MFVTGTRLFYISSYGTLLQHMYSMCIQDKKEASAEQMQCQLLPHLPVISILIGVIYSEYERQYHGRRSLALRTYNTSLHHCDYYTPVLIIITLLRPIYEEHTFYFFL